MTMADLNRLMSFSTNPAGLVAAAGAIYAATVMITNAVHGHGVIDPEVVVAAVGAVASLFVRQNVTPVADPKDRNGNPLTPVPLLPPPAASPGAGYTWPPAVTPLPVPVTPPPPSPAPVAPPPPSAMAPPEAPPTQTDLPPVPPVS